MSQRGSRSTATARDHGVRSDGLNQEHAQEIPRRMQNGSTTILKWERLYTYTSQQEFYEKKDTHNADSHDNADGLMAGRDICIDLIG